MIDRFFGEWRFLSNFWPCGIILPLDGKLYASVEHAYQAAKSDDPILRAMIREATSAKTAKMLGRKAHLRAGWDDERLVVMEALLRGKFRNGPLMTKLVATRPHELVEGNTWGDTFWGVSEGRGENHLGRLLMLIRDEGSVVTKVVNKRDVPEHELLDPTYVYIGRGGPWGNPFVLGQHGSRDEVIAKFRAYLWAAIEERQVSLTDLAELHGKTLVCFCKPEPCHGDVLAAASAWAVAELQAQA